VQGSGRKGRITKEDLERGGAPAPAGPAPPAGEGERVALTRIQQLSRDAVARSWQTVPHVTQNEDADITELEAFRKQLNAEQSDVKVTMVALLLKACSATLDAFPRFASSLDGDELVIKRERHLGFAADTPNGLVVPVIRDVDHKGLFELAAELTELSGKARAGKLGPKDISGAVFTISSLGGIGGTAFTPIVNLPQVAILGVVRSAMKPVWNGSEFEPRLMLPLSLSYDHRVIDGAAAARFGVHLAGVLKDLRRVLL
jgi:pyruvate dehydrogenase E2 component (dihydrolipoamide acetyltransferase)